MAALADSYFHDEMFEAVARGELLSYAMLVLLEWREINGQTGIVVRLRRERRNGRAYPRQGKFDTQHIFHRESG
ncbi:hypothetical protein [Paenibacillus sp. DMB20]|uniref:hypothetical protein n=1 Tax=Paenibacillus sp. DMB20 TaxID=1642570 RepID=UPI00062753D0|nr:hypothetical protein [Paenibacillus sp. DMB20]KKO54040.1 hypothetical protein XI25_07980 [Paenibacillus sp. DMB20]